MLINIEDPNILGEHFRKCVFKGPGVGCYESFNVYGNFKVSSFTYLVTVDMKILDLFTTDVSEYKKIEVRTGWQGDYFIVCAYFLEGDGTLFFSVRERTRDEVIQLINYDCKKIIIG